MEEESKRLNSLLAYKILDTVPEEFFDAITKMAAKICDTPIALISLVDDKRQWFKSRFGLEAPSTPKEISFCQQAIKEDEIYEVENALNTDLFKDNPLVTGDPNIRFMPESH
jgi:GAF domain-containing protein